MIQLAFANLYYKKFHVHVSDIVPQSLKPEKTVVIVFVK